MTKVKIGKKGGAKRVAAKIAKLRNPFPVRKNRDLPAGVRGTNPNHTDIVERYRINGVEYRVIERLSADTHEIIYRVLKSVGRTGWEFIEGRWETYGGARGAILSHLHRAKREAE